MPEKQKESKILSMLEKRGMIRKVEGSDPADASSASSSGAYNPDIRPLFENPDNDIVTVKTAPRQPVPGLTTPVFPSERGGPPEADVMQQPIDVPVMTATPPPPQVAAQAPLSAPPQAPVAAAPPPAPAYSAQSAPAPYSELAKPAASSFGGLGLFRTGEGGGSSGAMDSSSRDAEVKPENYTDRYLNINELYDALALRSKKTDTIYLIEEYLQTLPGSLPDSQRREIVSKILESSGFDFDLLMGDGVLRVKMLKEYAERFARHTDDYIAARQAELDELDQQMQLARRLIENRKELHKKQFYTIEAEAQRLKEILTFISG